MWSHTPRRFPKHLKAGFTSAVAPDGFVGGRFTFDLQGDGESEDSLLSRRWLLNHCGLSEDAWYDVEQVHGHRLIECTTESRGKREQADAVWTRTEGSLLAIRTADCVPLLLTSTETPLAVAIHAGWRGTHQQIVSRSVKAIVEELGISPSSLLGVIGPAIHPRAFEVDADVAMPFREVYGSDVVRETPGKSARWNVDLIEANRLELLDAGLSEQCIDILSLCTFDNTNFWSYRRQRGDAGRQVAWIAL